jgi:LmbE family N-acetylglucosaminyl deacetylase
MVGRIAVIDHSSEGEITMSENPISVLAIGAHPDDLELQCAGTLARYVQQGARVNLAIATDGSAGHRTIPAKELVKVRKQEATRSASILGVDLHWLGFPDERLAEDIDTRLRFIELIRLVRPQVILTHHPQDYHPDHRAVNHLVFAASFVAQLPNVQTVSPALEWVPALYYFENFSGVNFIPSEFVDITSTFGLKRQMLACHQSQMTWLEERQEQNFLEMIAVQARFRGLQCGVTYAEGFTFENVAPRLTTRRLLP